MINSFGSFEIGSKRLVPIAREGYPFILASFIPPVITSALGLWWPTAITLVLAWWVVWFFRDPEREIPGDQGSIVSPADGKVIKIARAREDRLLGDEALKISIFMNIFNVHVNRAPASGRVVGTMYNPGKFFNASLDKASLENEQNLLLIEAANGRRFAVCQIAGLVARRIVCYVGEGSRLEKGERFGLIRFGSRLDVYLPLDAKVKVRVGDKVKAGSSVLACWRD